ncbi:MAG: branched-chain amino acid ABC transporter permease [Candidatus Nanopelagicales bacterium]
MRTVLQRPWGRAVATMCLMLVSALLWMLVNNRVDALWNLRLAYVATYAVALFGMVVLVGHSGQVSLGNGAFMASGGYAFALAVMHGWPSWLGMLAAAVVGAAVGVAVGVVAARLSGPYLAGLTLGLAVGLPALANRFPDLLGGDSGLLLDGPYPPDRLGPDFPLERWQAWVAGATAIFVVALVSSLIVSPLGRSIRATRDHEPAAALVGINTSRTKVIAFAVSAVCAALAGAVLTQILGLAAPGAFGIGLSLSLLVGTIVGGRQSLVGAVIGALLLALTPEWLTALVSNFGLPDQVGLNLPNLVYGGLLLLTVGLAPGGIANIRRAGAR